MTYGFSIPFLFVPAVAVGSAGGKGVLPHKFGHTARFAHGVVQMAQGGSQVVQTQFLHQHTHPHGHPGIFHCLSPNPILTICIFIPLSPTLARNRKKPLTEGSFRSLYCHHCRQHRRYDCHAHRAEQPLFLLVFCGDVGLQIFRSGDRPCVRMPHSVTIDQKAVDQIHNGQDDEQLPEARRKAARTVYPIDTDQHIADISGDADGFEK